MNRIASTSASAIRLACIALALVVVTSVSAFAAPPTSIPTTEQTLDAQNIAALKKFIRYPLRALDFKQEGRFDLLVYIDANGNQLAVNFDMKNDNDDPLSMSLLIGAATEAVGKYPFPAEYRNSIVRVPFNFMLLK
jgi:hypothetical protein